MSGAGCGGGGVVNNGAGGDASACAMEMCGETRKRPHGHGYAPAGMGQCDSASGGLGVGDGLRASKDRRRPTRGAPDCQCRQVSMDGGEQCARELRAPLLS